MLKTIKKHRLMRKKLIKNNKGMTLVELLVALAILSASLVPLLNSFVTTAKINNRSNVTQNATTVAQNVFEGIKNFGIDTTIKQCEKYHEDASQFKIIAGNLNDAVFQDKSVSGTGLKNLEFVFKGVECGGLEYCAKAEVTEDPSVGAGEVGRNNGASQTNMSTKGYGTRYKKYYSVKVTVYKDNGGSTGDKLATYDGSLLDYYN